MELNTVKIIEIDLDHEQLKEKKWESDVIKKYLGGPGFAIKYLLENKAYEYEPLNEKSPFIFMTGLLTGTSYPCSGFYSVSARSPLTNIYGEGLSGGFFGAELRKIINGLIFINKATTPVYIVLDENNVEIKDASEIWGLTTDKTIKTLQDKLGKHFKIACIGPAGERLVPLASIMNDHFRAVGRTGMGAVMGSKNLKAIAVNGGKKKIEYYNKEKFNELSKKLFKAFKESPMADVLKNFGTNNIDYFERLNDVPHKNWTLHKFRGVNQISGAVVLEKLHVRSAPCFSCPFSCGRVIEIKEGPYKIENAAGAEYETTAAFGAMCLIDNVEAIAYINHLCNTLGIDTISTGCTIAFAMDCFENGILTQEDIGFSLNWGDIDAVIKIVELIAKNEGIGKILGKGSRKAAELIDKGAEQYLAEIKGLEAPMHDPRAIFPLGLQYATSNRGACHLRGFANDSYSGFTGFNDALEITKELPIRKRTIDNPAFAKDVVLTQNLSEINNALGVCRQTISSGSQIVDDLFDLLLKAIYYLTGMEFTLKELLNIGGRIFTMKRVFNTKFGISRKDDTLPSRLQYPLKKGLTKNKILKIDAMLDKYYKIRGWNENGIPTEETLKKLEINLI
ncbi:MAG: aldehyde ferredoxin oxidoreductase family protein [Promethearchaeota archaeon]